MAEDFQLPLGTEAGVNLDESFADGRLTPSSLPAELNVDHLTLLAFLGHG